MRQPAGVSDGPLARRWHGLRAGRTRAGERAPRISEPHGQHGQRATVAGGADRGGRQRARTVQRGAVRGPADRRLAQHVHGGQSDAVPHVHRAAGHGRTRVRRPQPPDLVHGVRRDDRTAVRRRPAGRGHEKVHGQPGAVPQAALLRAVFRADHVPRPDGRVRAHRAAVGRPPVRHGPALRHRRRPTARRHGRFADVPRRASGRRASGGRRRGRRPRLLVRQGGRLRRAVARHPHVRHHSGQHDGGRGRVRPHQPPVHVHVGQKRVPAFVHRRRHDDGRVPRRPREYRKIDRRV